MNSNEEAAWRARYEDVMDSVLPEERAEIESLRVTPGQRGYMHDLTAAIARGWRNKSRAAIRVAMTCQGYAGTYGREHDHNRRFEYRMVLSDLIQVAAEEGVSAEDIKLALQRSLDTKDHFQIEKIVGRVQIEKIVQAKAEHGS